MKTRIITALLLLLVTSGISSSSASGWDDSDSRSNINPNCLFNDVRNIFADQYSNQTFAVSVYWLCDAGVVHGKGNGYFGANDSVRRDEFSQIIYVAHQIPLHVPPSSTCQFDDVPSSNQFYAAISSICYAGIVTGYTPGPHGVFGPGFPVSRAELAAFVYRANQPDMHAYTPPNNNHTYTDVLSSTWSFVYVETLYYYNVIAGKGGPYNPNSRAIRGDTCAFVELAASATQGKFRLGQAFAYINPGNAIGVNSFKTVPNGFDVDHWASGPVGLSNMDVQNPSAQPNPTFIESGPSANHYHVGNNKFFNYFSWRAGSNGNNQPNLSYTIQAGYRYDYYTIYQGNNTWLISACDDGACRDLTAINLGVSSLPYVGSNAETSTPPAPFGTTYVSIATYIVGNNTSPWCWSQIYNGTDADINNCTSSQTPNYNYNWSINW